MDKILELHYEHVLGASEHAKKAVPVDVSESAEWYYRTVKNVEYDPRNQICCYLVPYEVSFIEYVVPDVWNMVDEHGKWGRKVFKEQPTQAVGAYIRQERLAPLFAGDNPSEGGILNTLADGMAEWEHPSYRQRVLYFMADKGECCPVIGTAQYLDRDGRLLGAVVTQNMAAITDRAVDIFLRVYGLPIWFSVMALYNPHTLYYRQSEAPKFTKRNGNRQLYYVKVDISPALKRVPTTDPEHFNRLVQERLTVKSRLPDLLVGDWWQGGEPSSVSC